MIYTDLSLIFVFMSAYTISTIMLSFFLSTLFNRANIAAAAGGIIFFCLYLPYSFMVVWESKITHSIRIASVSKTIEKKRFRGRNRNLLLSRCSATPILIHVSRAGIGRGGGAAAVVPPIPVPARLTWIKIGVAEHLLVRESCFFL